MSDVQKKQDPDADKCTRKGELLMKPFQNNPKGDKQKRQVMKKLANEENPDGKTRTENKP